MLHSVATGRPLGLGRWLSEDPAGIAGGTNLYTYAGNDPVNGRDPSGQDYTCSVYDGSGGRVIVVCYATPEQCSSMLGGETAASICGEFMSLDVCTRMGGFYNGSGQCFLDLPSSDVPSTPGASQNPGAQQAQNVGTVDVGKKAEDKCLAARNRAVASFGLDAVTLGASGEAKAAERSAELAYGEARSLYRRGAANYLDPLHASQASARNAALFTAGEVAGHATNVGKEVPGFVNSPTLLNLLKIMPLPLVGAIVDLTEEIQACFFP